MSLPEVVRRMRTAIPEVAGKYTQLPDSRLANDRRFSGDCVSVSTARRLASRVSNLQQSTSRDHVTSSLSRDCIRYFSVSSPQRHVSIYQSAERGRLCKLVSDMPSLPFASLINSRTLLYPTIRSDGQAIACVNRPVVEGQALDWT